MFGLQDLVKAKLSRKKKKMYIETNRTNLTSDWNNFQQATAVARKTWKEANNFVSKAFPGNSSTNPIFFSYVKTKRCKNVGTALLCENGTIVISNTEKLYVLNNQFCSAFTKKDFRIPKLTPPIFQKYQKLILIMKKALYEKSRPSYS